MRQKTKIILLIFMFGCNFSLLIPHGNKEANVTYREPEMVLLPGGEFVMGSNEKDTNDYYPAHKVYVDPFYIDKTEVTNAQYHKYCKETGKKLPKFWGIAEFRCSLDYPHHPVVGVSCYEAKLYAEWRGVRLPTEAEWEYAARGGLTGKSFPLGDDIGPEDGNVANQTGGSAKVGSYKANGYGLYDMAGNVREWVSDYYEEDYYQHSTYRNPKGPAAGKFIVLRGGGWFAGKSCCRVFIRNALKNTWIDFNVGFRCAKDHPANGSEKEE
jgi:iron(II)-dependent oxidoreductase